MTRTTQNRPERELVPGQSEALLRELHLVSRDGKLHADSLRKLKQVNHLAQLLAPALDDVLARHPSAQILDAGAGNAYLGFVLYELFLKAGEALLWNVEPRADLIARGEERAKKLGYSRMRFVGATLEQAAQTRAAAPGAALESAATSVAASVCSQRTSRNGLREWLDSALICAATDRFPTPCSPRISTGQSVSAIRAMAR